MQFHKFPVLSRTKQSKTLREITAAGPMMEVVIGKCSNTAITNILTTLNVIE